MVVQHFRCCMAMGDAGQLSLAETHQQNCIWACWAVTHICGCLSAGHLCTGHAALLEYGAPLLVLRVMQLLSALGNSISEPTPTHDPHHGSVVSMSVGYFYGACSTAGTVLLHIVFLFVVVTTPNDIFLKNVVIVQKYKV